MREKKVRLDELLVSELGVESIARAQALILTGDVLVDEVPVNHAGYSVGKQSAVRIRGAELPFVSRGGGKLDGALTELGISVEGLIALDIGASTGGFTDCLLQRGAVHVYAVDVGQSQLRWSLNQDPRVTVWEGLDGRKLDRHIHFPVGSPNFVVADISFIGLSQVLPSVINQLSPGWVGLFLVKPQFELPREDISPGGVVRDTLLHEKAVEMVTQAVERSGGLVQAVVASQVVGGKKRNQEYFLYARSAGASAGSDDLER